MVLKRPHTSHCLIWCVSVRVCVCVLGLLQRHWNLTPPNCNRSADTDSHTAVDGEDASNKQSQQSLLRWTYGRREEVLAEQGRGRVRKRRTGSKRWRAGETPCPGGFGVRRGHKPSPPGWDPSCSPTGWLWYYFFGPHFLPNCFFLCVTFFRTVTRHEKFHRGNEGRLSEGVGYFQNLRRPTVPSSLCWSCNKLVSKWMR